jgi:hypothetical protein
LAHSGNDPVYFIKTSQGFKAGCRVWEGQLAHETLVASLISCMDAVNDGISFGECAVFDRCGTLELEVQLESRVIHEHLSAIWALHLAICLDSDIVERAIT